MWEVPRASFSPVPSKGKTHRLSPDLVASLYRTVHTQSQATAEAGDRDVRASPLSRGHKGMPHPSPWRFSQLAGSLSHLSFRAGMGKSSALSAARLCFPGRDEVGSEWLPLPSSVPWVSDSSEEDSERRALGTVFTGDTQKETIKTYSCLGSSRHTWLGKHFSDTSECGQKSRGSASLPELCPRLTNK